MLLGAETPINHIQSIASWGIPEALELITFWFQFASYNCSAEYFMYRIYSQV